MEIDFANLFAAAKPCLKHWRWIVGCTLLAVGIAGYSLSLSLAAIGLTLIAYEFRNMTRPAG